MVIIPELFQRLANRQKTTTNTVRLSLQGLFPLTMLVIDLYRGLFLQPEQQGLVVIDNMTNVLTHRMLTLQPETLLILIR